MQRAKTRKARPLQHNDPSRSRYLIDAGYGTDAALRRTAALLRRPAATCLRVNTLRADPAAIAVDLVAYRAEQCGPALARIAAAVGGGGGGGGGGGVETYSSAPECLLIRPVYNPLLEADAGGPPARSHSCAPSRP